MDYGFAMTELCRVLVTDDDPMVREAYRMFLTRNDNHEVVGEARNGREAVEAYEELKPDVVLMDLQMPDMSGVDAIREINRKHRGACIVALTTFGTQEYIVSALRAGASGYLMKDCGGPALLTGIQREVAIDIDLLQWDFQKMRPADWERPYVKMLWQELKNVGNIPSGSF